MLPDRFPVEAQLQRLVPVEDPKTSKLDVTNSMIKWKNEKQVIRTQQAIHLETETRETG